MSDYHLAQLNIARPLAPIDSPLLKEFNDNLGYINGLAEAAAGFVWRWETRPGDPIEGEVFGAGCIVNLSVWESMTPLRQFVYHSEHLAFLRRKKEWFESMAEAHMVLWWQAAGSLPNLHEAKRRLDLLRNEGPSEQAFSFKRHYPKPKASMGSGTASDNSCLIS
ncbi:MAG: DUF3291 domain-containing protein [Oleiphilaceae bacterium]|nr:DUF3291 domain-containing protein [Oleiphilaceae bacterium]